jgi:hypothetical protein
VSDEHCTASCGAISPFLQALAPAPHNPARIVASRAWLQRCCLTAARARTRRKESSQDHSRRVLTSAIILVCMHLSPRKGGDEGSSRPLTFRSPSRFPRSLFDCSRSPDTGKQSSQDRRRRLLTSTFGHGSRTSVPGSVSTSLTQALRCVCPRCPLKMPAELEQPLQRVEASLVPPFAAAGPVLPVPGPPAAALLEGALLGGPERARGGGRAHDDQPAPCAERHALRRQVAAALLVRRFKRFLSLLECFKVVSRSFQGHLKVILRPF